MIRVHKGNCMCLFLLYLIHISSEMENDCQIQIHQPYFGRTYSSINLNSNITISFGDGYVSTLVRNNPELFYFCISWDIWKWNPSQNDEFCQQLSEARIPSFPSQDYQDGIHRFQASLKIRNQFFNLTTIENNDNEFRTIISEELSYFTVTPSIMNEKNTGTEKDNNKLRDDRLYQCEYSGKFPAVVPWSKTHNGDSSNAPLALAGARLDIPFDVRDVTTWEQAEESLFPQLLGLCETNHQGLSSSNDQDSVETWFNSGWTPMECANDILRQCKEWYLTQCELVTNKKEQSEEFLTSKSKLPHLPSLLVNIDNQVELSLQSFRYEVSSYLNLDHLSNWTIETIDELIGPSLNLIHDEDQTDGCSEIIKNLLSESSSFSNSSSNDRIYILGSLIKNHFIKRQRHFVFRDLLGCLSNVHICIDNEDDVKGEKQLSDEELKKECEDLVAYAKVQKAKNLQRRKQQVNTNEGDDWVCGPCPSLSFLHDKPSILVSGFSALDETDHLNTLLDSLDKKDDNDDDAMLLQSGNLDFVLKARWHPNVIIHLNDESGTSFRTLKYLYKHSQLVLRMYGSGGFRYHVNNDEDDVDKEQINSKWNDVENCQVVSIPIGFLNDFADSQENVPKSGTQAIRDATSSYASRNSLWSFTGSRCGHHPHVADARSAMAAWMPSASYHLKVNCHFTERDGYQPATETAGVYRSSLFVGSPRGESTDCFRHYEAMISGAIPIVDVPYDNEQWNWRQPRTVPSHSSASDSPQQQSLPSHPLGWVYPHSSSFKHHQGIIQDNELLWTARSKQISEWPSFMSSNNVNWKSLSQRVLQMGEVEIQLRRQLNLRWYLAEIQTLRTLIYESVLKKKEKPGVIVKQKKQMIISNKPFGENDSSILKVIEQQDDKNCKFTKCFQTIANSKKSFILAIKKSVELSSSLANHHDEKISYIITVSRKHLKLDEPLVIQGKHLSLTIRGRPSSTSTLKHLNNSSSIPCADHQVILDGQGRVRVLLIQHGATLHLDNVMIFRGAVFGDGAGIQIQGIGSELTSGFVYGPEAPKQDMLEVVNQFEKFGSTMGSLKSIAKCHGSISFVQNSVAGFSGGGLSVSDGAIVKMGRAANGVGPLFVDNIANSAGGAVSLMCSSSSSSSTSSSSLIEMTSALFLNNSAYRGGGLSLNGFKNKLKLINAVFKNNIAYWDGGAVYINSGGGRSEMRSQEVSMDHVTFVNNSVSMGGSALHLTNYAQVYLGPKPPLFHDNLATYGNCIAMCSNSSLVIALWLGATALNSPEVMSTGDLSSLPLHHGEKLNTSKGILEVKFVSH